MLYLNSVFKVVGTVAVFALVSGVVSVISQHLIKLMSDYPLFKKATTTAKIMTEQLLVTEGFNSCVAKTW